MPRKKNRKSRRRSRSKKKAKNSLFPIILFTVFVLLLFFTLFIFYLTHIFPDILNKKIKKDMIALFSPNSLEDSRKRLTLHLKIKPADESLKKAYNFFSDNYGLKIKFEETGFDNTVRVLFYKNNKIYSDIKEIYFTCDRKEIISEEYLKNKEVQEYERHEEKKIHEKTEKLEEPETDKFLYCRQQETPDYKAYRIAIIIDDVGYGYNSTYKFLSLGFPVTFAVIPDMPKSRSFYRLFNKYGYRMILHIPMEPLKGKQYVEKNAILEDMSDAEIKNRLEYFLESYPDIIGANNHMGSRAVQDDRIMNDLMEEISVRKIIWLDSMTGSVSRGKIFADKYEVKYYKRDVFLDNENDMKHIRSSMEELIRKAKINGYAIGIGHIQNENLAKVLKEYYNERKKHNISFVFLDNLGNTLSR